MKKDLHPTYYTDVKVTCACGNSFVTGATVESISVEICAACHPFFTGKSKLIDTAGRVDKFKDRVARAAKLKAKQKSPAKGKLVVDEADLVAKKEDAQIDTEADKGVSDEE